jgi:ThiF family
MIRVEKFMPIDDCRMIYQVGAGGIGGYLAPMIARMVSEHNRPLQEVDQYQYERQCLNYALMDDDEVEDKNLLRQNFSLGDLGKNKAEVISTRCSAVFGIEIEVIKERLVAESKITEPQGRRILVVSCVDNHKTRGVIENIMRNSYKTITWIDIANDVTNGQVFISRMDSVVPILMSRIHPEILNSDKKGSCAVDDRQLFQTNMMAAMTGFNVIWDVMKAGYNYYEVMFNIANSMRKLYLKDYK